MKTTPPLQPKGGTDDPPGERTLGFVEHGFYVAVAAALAVVGLVLFGYAAYTFVTGLGKGNVESNIIELLDSLLLVFIVAELIHTIRNVIAESVLRLEPFLIVGIIAAIRRLLVISVEASDKVGAPDFPDLMMETGLLAASVLALGFTIFLLRQTTRTEPRPSYDVDQGNREDQA